jgi:hypothetical protein
VKTTYRGEELELLTIEEARARPILCSASDAERSHAPFRTHGPRGTVTGTLTVSSATANGTTLGISGATGSFAAGDWIQISTSLYKIVQVNSSSSVDVFPVLRSSYAGGTAITYNNAKGVFRLAEPSTQWSIDTAKFYGVSFNVLEDVA